jgi:HD-GYP domain-containing protein (c-di-GMP phosphodiesterase class II)
MPVICLKSDPSERAHQFVVGAIPIAAYLADWQAPVWAAVGLSLGAMLSSRLVIVSRLYDLLKHRSATSARPFFHDGVRRFDEATRATLLGLGLAVLLTDQPLGWLAVLGAASAAILTSTTGFSFSAVLYALIHGAGRGLVRGPRPGFGVLEPAPAAASVASGNPNCLVCRSLGAAPYERCLWCNLASLRACWGLQTSLFLILLLVIAFLLTAGMQPLMTKLLVTTCLVAVVALALEVARQTGDLMVTLENLSEEERRAKARCAFLGRLAMAPSVEAAAEEVAAFTEQALHVRRISVMVAREGTLRIAASRGIPAETAARVTVPIGERICGRVFESGQPVVFSDVADQGPPQPLGLDTGPALASYPLVALRPTQGDPEHRRGVAAGMKTAGRKVGVVNVTDGPPESFSADGLAQLQFISDAAAISLCSQLDRLDLEQANHASIVTLALAMEAKDPYTNGHSLRVQSRAAAVARALGFAGPRLQCLVYSAELHDIGKLAIPDEILNAPRRLTQSEWKTVQLHPGRGIELVQHLTHLKAGHDAILHHHEHLDGTGYPGGLRGDDISQEARILAVVDAYDAMTSARAYRPPMSHEEAAAELRRCAGTQFDSEIVEALLRLPQDLLALTVSSAAEPVADVGAW